MDVRGHRELVVWQKAMELTKCVYAVTARFPPEERYGLVSQMRRAAVSVPSNIAEGAGRGSRREFRRFVMVTRGSLSELETQCLLAWDLGLAPRSEPVMRLISEIFRMLASLQRRLAEVPYARH